MNRGVLFLAFAGEEIGLLGSQHYGNQPLLPLSKAVAMVNMDMIGRAGKNKLVVGGTGSGSGLEALVQDLAKARKIEVDTSRRATYGSSDHTTFQARMVPVLFFFTGLHADYHRPSDTAEKIDAKATAQLLDLISHVTETLARQGGRPEFVRVKRGEAAVGGGGGGGAKEFLMQGR
jgi:Zn-dependent M28 family amino/carboxypeptidase